MTPSLFWPWPHCPVSVAQRGRVYSTFCQLCGYPIEPRQPYRWQPKDRYRQVHDACVKECDELRENSDEITEGTTTQNSFQR